MEFTLPVHYVLKRKRKRDKKILVGMNWYRNAHYFETNKVKRHYLSLVKAQMVALPTFDRIRIHYTIYVQRKNTDGSNILAVIDKFFVDALVELGAIRDDSLMYVAGISSEYKLDRSNPRVEISIADENEPKKD